MFQFLTVNNNLLHIKVNDFINAYTCNWDYFCQAVHFLICTILEVIYLIPLWYSGNLLYILQFSLTKVQYCFLFSIYLHRSFRSDLPFHADHQNYCYFHQQQSSSSLYGRWSTRCKWTENQKFVKEKRELEFIAWM